MKNSLIIGSLQPIKLKFRKPTLHFYVYFYTKLNLIYGIKVFKILENMYYIYDLVLFGCYFLYKRSNRYNYKFRSA